MSSSLVQLLFSLIHCILNLRTETIRTVGWAKLLQADFKLGGYETTLFPKTVDDIARSHVGSAHARLVSMIILAPCAMQPFHKTDVIAHARARLHIAGHGGTHSILTS